MVAGFAALEDAGGRPRRVLGIDALGQAGRDPGPGRPHRPQHRPRSSELGRDLRDDEIELDERYHAGTYGIPDEATLDAMRLAARTEGMITDPVYEGKSMAGAHRPGRTAGDRRRTRPSSTPTSAASRRSTATARCSPDRPGHAENSVVRRTHGARSVEVMDVVFERVDARRYLIGVRRNARTDVGADVTPRPGRATPRSRTTWCTSSSRSRRSCRWGSTVRSPREGRSAGSSAPTPATGTRPMTSAALAGWGRPEPATSGCRSGWRHSSTSVDGCGAASGGARPGPR